MIMIIFTKFSIIISALCDLSWRTIRTTSSCSYAISWRCRANNEQNRPHWERRLKTLLLLLLPVLQWTRIFEAFDASSLFISMTMSTKASILDGSCRAYREMNLSVCTAIPSLHFIHSLKMQSMQLMQEKRKVMYIP